MRHRTAIAVVLVAATVTMAAPSASAREYHFRATDGTACGLVTTHSKTPQADGNWTVSWWAGLTCDRALRWGSLHSSFRDTDGPLWVNPSFDSWCSVYHRPCGTWTMTSYGSASDLPPGRYQVDNQVEMTLMSAPDALGVAPVWAVAAPSVPCAPGSDTIACTVSNQVLIEPLDDVRPR